MSAEFDTLTFTLPLAGPVCMNGVKVEYAPNTGNYSITVASDFDPQGAAMRVGEDTYCLSGKRQWRVSCGANVNEVQGKQVKIRFPNSQVKQADQLKTFNDPCVSDLTVIVGESVFHVSFAFRFCVVVLF